MSVSVHESKSCNGGVSALMCASVQLRSGTQWACDRYLLSGRTSDCSHSFTSRAVQGMGSLFLLRPSGLCSLNLKFFFDPTTIHLSCFSSSHSSTYSKSLSGRRESAHLKLLQTPRETGGETVNLRKAWSTQILSQYLSEQKKIK